MGDRITGLAMVIGAVAVSLLAAALHLGYAIDRNTQAIQWLRRDVSEDLRARCSDDR